MKLLHASLVFAVLSTSFGAQAAQYLIDLSPPVGDALNPTNYAVGDHATGLSALNAVGQPASLATGGETGGGIIFDDVTGELTINIGYGSDFGFIDLSGDYTTAHVHGPVAAQFPAPNTGAGVSFGLTHVAGSSARTGFIGGTFNLTPTQQAQLFANQLYVNVHSSFAGGGEIRGQLVPVALLASAPINHWPLDGDLLDAIGSADGTMVGVQSNVTGRLSGALSVSQ